MWPQPPPQPDCFQKTVFAEDVHLDRIFANVVSSCSEATFVECLRGSFNAREPLNKEEVLCRETAIHDEEHMQ